MSDNDVTITFSGNIGSLKQQVDQVSQSISGIGSTSTAASKLTSELFTSMQRASDTAVRGILLGTQTWQNALKRAGTDVLASFINDVVVNRTLQWLKSELTMTQATEIGNAARTASDDAAGDASLAAKAGAAISSLMNDSVEVFGGIFAYLSPLLGPAAAGPAAAGGASVASLAGDIVYAESGAWNLPSNTMAYLHAGEMVVPKPFASYLRDGGGLGGGGGDQYNVTIQAIDTQTGAQFLKNNASAIAQTLSTQARNYSKYTQNLKS